MGWANFVHGDYVRAGAFVGLGVFSKANVKKANVPVKFSSLCNFFMIFFFNCIHLFFNQRAFVLNKDSISMLNIGFCNYEGR